jgi:hypothetical protein
MVDLSAFESGRDDRWVEEDNSPVVDDLNSGVLIPLLETIKLQTRTQKLEIKFNQMVHFHPSTPSSAEENACYRCFNLQMVSKNIILLIHNEVDINSKCSSSAETVSSQKRVSHFHTITHRPSPSFQVKCPKEIALNDENKFENDFHSIILYSEFQNTVNSCLFSMFTSIRTPFFICRKKRTRRSETK